MDADAACQSVEGALMRNPAIRIDRIPAGLPAPADFSLVDAPVPPLEDGHVLFRARYMSLDPAMRRYLPAPRDWPGPLGGTAIPGGLAIAGPRPPADGRAGPFIGIVETSRHPGFVQGDLVQGGSFWQTRHVVPGGSLARLPEDCDASEQLGLLGQPGFVAWCGMNRIGRPKPGETLVVSAAGGAVGMVAGQLGKAAGARVIGIASGSKARFAVDELGFDACIDRFAEDVPAALDRLCPQGIDIYFDNVGGAVASAAFSRLRDFGRFVVCGMASEYNAAESAAGPPLRAVLRKRLRIEGFVVYDHYDEFDRFRAEMLALRAKGRIGYRCEFVDGLENAPEGLARLLQGTNRGKMIVRLNPD